jgi:hypothetical protein
MSFKSKISIIFILGLVMATAFSNLPMAMVSAFGLACTQSFQSGYAYLLPNIDIIGACAKIRKEVADMGAENYAFTMKRKTGALDFITSPENGSVDANLISYQSGKKIAKLQLLYDQRTKPCQIRSDEDSNVCDDGSTPVRKEAIITIANHLKTPVREYSNQDMIALCKDTKTFMRERAMSDFIAAHEFFSERILAFLDSEIGKNKEWDGTTTNAGQYKDIQLLATESGQRIPKTGNFVEMLEDYANNELTGTPAIIGQGNFAMFAKLFEMSCCNSATPYGLSNITDDARFYLDQAGNAVLGPSKVILAAFKAVHLLTFNENNNININTDTQAHVVIPDPMGYPFDWNLDFYFDKCSKTWKSQYSLLWGTFNKFQDDSFSADGEDTSPDTSPDCNDRLDGVSAVFGYNVTAA